MSILLVVLGAFFLYLGGEALLKGSVHLARSWGMSPLVVGLTVVAFGTSSPEFAATLIAAMRGLPDMALGNVIGSNTANMGLILGLTALLCPIRSRARFIAREIPLMLAVLVLLVPVIADQVVSRLEAMALIFLLAPYLWVLLRSREAGGVEQEFAQAYGEAALPVWQATASVLIGIGLLVVGAQVLVEGGVGLARSLGVSERIIGVTLVAVGTSLPELATALVAAFRREADIVIGNLVGSNVFNVLGVLGTAALLHPLEVTLEGTWLNIGVMLAFSVMALPLLATRPQIGRVEGALLVGSYLVYVGYLYS